jgi:asparagine synthase (glutamine-hydrolysing)
MAQLEETVAGLESDRFKVSALELTWYMRHQLLRDTDWAGMAHSLEVRVPFVDVTVLRDLAPLLASGKPPGKSEMARTPARSLPAQVLSRRKTGFCVPVREWLMKGSGDERQERGLRGWTRHIYAAFNPGRSAGGHDGIPGGRKQASPVKPHQVSLPIAWKIAGAAPQGR